MGDPAPAWLSIVGMGEDGLEGLAPASRAALDRAEIIFGGPRHLDLAGAGARGRPWPVPFSVAPVLALRGRRVAILASGDPFWYGAGGSLAAVLAPDDWQAFPAPSTFALVAARLGWRIEETDCLGLHAMPFERLVPKLRNGWAAICLVRDGPAAGSLMRWLDARGYGASTVWILEALGGQRERVRQFPASGPVPEDIAAPVAVAFIATGPPGLPGTSGLADDAFRHDGQITRRPIRALTLSALAPRPGERLWDIGAGSGSVAIEWLLATGSRGHAIAIEARADRAEAIRANGQAFGLEDRLSVVAGRAPAALAGLAPPDAVFLGGGADGALLAAVWQGLPAGARLVVNAVTLETEALLIEWAGQHGGELVRIEIAEAAPLGRFRGWVPGRPIVQWSVTR
ncbi:MAG: precorrin-6y C5,15-methyltransferase (decarboxylating) subunit CbiE [Hyphomicrobiaceae bacterium]|nr:precorrin-6y C5,15-methyltransferase (decarboxylating) subunit CbiE [Hyphomicrobiaceae bacterium]